MDIPVGPSECLKTSLFVGSNGTWYLRRLRSRPMRVIPVRSCSLSKTNFTHIPLKDQRRTKNQTLGRQDGRGPCTDLRQRDYAPPRQVLQRSVDIKAPFEDPARPSTLTVLAYIFSGGSVWCTIISPSVRSCILLEAGRNLGCGTGLHSCGGFFFLL